MPSTAIREVAVLKAQSFHIFTRSVSSRPSSICADEAADHPNVVKLHVPQSITSLQKIRTFAKLRLDVACSPGRLHLVFEFVDANLKQPVSRMVL